MKNKTKIVAIVLIGLFLLSLFGKNNYKTTVKQYVTASMEGNGKKIVNLMPKQYINLAISQGLYHNKAEMIEDYNDTLSQNIELLDDCFGKRWKYDYDIIDAHKYSKSELEGFITISNYAHLLPNIKEVREVTYELKIFSCDYESTTTETILLIKLGRKWHVSDAYS